MTDIVRLAQLRLDVIRETKMRSDVPRLLKDLGLSDSPQEAIWVITHDADMHVRTVIEVARGSYKAASLHIPALLAAVLTSGADRFDIAHNHPSGNLSPTKDDMDITTMVMNAANICGLWFEDHWIVTPKGPWTSFRRNGWIVPLPYGGEAKSL